MTPASVRYDRSSPGLPRAVLLGALTVGVLDITDALVFFGLRGAAPVRIFQSIASGVLGRDAFQGGASSAALGLFLHFFIAFCIVAVYYMASHAIPALARRPWLYGPLYGVAVYVVMNQVVLPLSAAATGPKPLPVLINGVLIHILGVGLPSALFTRMARRQAGEMD
jgi:hypothetical protein